LRDWTVTNTDNKPLTFRLALEADATEAGIDSLVSRLKKMTKEASKVFGEFPAYDYGTYTFLASINPYVNGDGMEHRNSTMITTPRKFSTINNLPGVFSHEFFHCWNVERIRPQGIEPFNFEKSNMTAGLWVAEGFTQYYGDLIIMRSGLMKEENFLGSMSSLINSKMNTPGAQNYSPIESSQRAPFVDAGVSIDATNYENMYTSYYFYGAAIALALDLELRGKYNSSLDNFMKELWKRHGKTEKPYSMNDLEVSLAAITDKTYASDFFSKYVYGHEQFNYKDALAKMGLQLADAFEGRATAGSVSLVPRGNELVVANATRRNTPLYNAGVDRDDVLVSADGKELKEQKDFEAVISQHKPGDVMKIVYSHRGKTNEANVTLVQAKTVRIIASKEANALKTKWLSPQ
jgi:predicted metalloprotease with PDZ domain